jgi:hypothetical protein
MAATLSLIPKADIPLPTPVFTVAGRSLERPLLGLGQPGANGRNGARNRPAGVDPLSDVRS